VIIDKIFRLINFSRAHKFYFLSPHVYAVGNCAEEIYYGLIMSKELNKKLFILYSFDFPLLFKYKHTNKTLFNLQSEYIYEQNAFVNFLCKILVTCIYLPLRIFSLLVKRIFGWRTHETYNFPRIGRDDLYLPKKTNKFEFLFNNVEKYNWNKQFSHEFNITHKNEFLDQKIMEIMGIPKNHKYVCVHVRESGFRSDKGRRDYRNSDIFNYLKAFKEITSKNIWVVRMGDNTMKQLPKMDKVIDYPFTEHKSDSMDISLLKNCYFYIGCQSGIFDVAKLLNKPTLLVNMYNWTFGGTLHCNDRGLMKHIYSKKEKKFLSLEQILSGPIGWEIQDINNEVRDYLFFENTEDEILNAVKEFFQNLDKGISKVSNMQITVNEKIKRQADEIFSNNDRVITYDNSNVIEKYRMSSQATGNNGYLCNFYIENCWSEDNFFAPTS